MATMDEVPANVEQKQDNMWEYQTDRSLSGLSVWYEEFLQPTAMTSDTSTTAVPREKLAALAAERILRPMARSGTPHPSGQGSWGDCYDKALRDASKVRLEYRELQTTANTGRAYRRAFV